MSLILLGCSRGDTAVLPAGFFRADESQGMVQYPLVAVSLAGEQASLYHWFRSYGGHFMLGQSLNPYQGGSLWGATVDGVTGEFSPIDENQIRAEIRRRADRRLVAEYALQRISESQFKSSLEQERGTRNFHAHEDEACFELFRRSCAHLP